MFKSVLADKLITNLDRNRLVLLLVAHAFPLEFHPEVFVHPSSPVRFSNLRQRWVSFGHTFPKNIPLLVDAIGSNLAGTSTPSGKRLWNEKNVFLIIFQPRV